MASFFRLIALAGALALATCGAWLVGRPLHMSGPMNFNLEGPLGALMLVLGMLGFRALARAPVLYALAALLMLAAAGVTFYFYPPIPDGAYFLVRYGHTAGGEIWPASAAWHVIGFSGAAWSLALLIERGPPAKAWRWAGEAGLLVMLVIAGAVALELFTQLLPGVALPWPRAGLWLAGMLAITAAAWLARRRWPGRLAAVFSSLITLLAAATLALYQFG